MYYLVTDDTVILRMSSSYFRDVNGSQSDGLKTHFLSTSEGITYHSVIHYPFSNLENDAVEDAQFIT